MVTSLQSQLIVEVAAAYRNILDLGTPADLFTKRARTAFADGTGANAADRMFHDQRTIAASGTEDLDLAGSLSSPFGATLTFVELRLVLVTAAATNTNNVRLSRPASNGVPLFLAASDGIDVPPGGTFLWACPADGKVTVTAGTGDLLTVANSSSGTAVTYDIVIIGTSA